MLKNSNLLKVYWDVAEDGIVFAKQFTTYTGKKYLDEMIEFEMEYSFTNGDWPGFTIRVEKPDQPLWGGNTTYLLGRYVDTGNYNQMEMKDGRWTLWKQVWWSWTELASGDYTFIEGSTYNLKMEFKGDNITLYINGTEVASKKDATFTKGKIGLRTWTNQAQYDNVVVTLGN